MNIIRTSYCSLRCTFVIFSALLLSAQSTVADPIALDVWQLSGNAQIVDDEIILTPDQLNSSGRALINQELCANEFILSFDLNVGNRSGSEGGSGIAINMTTPMGAPLYRVHADTALTSFEDSRYEVNDNHLSIESAWASTDIFGNPAPAGGVIFGPLAAAQLPFEMKGAGWFHATLHKRADSVNILFSNGATEISLSAALALSPTELFKLGFEANTDAIARNRHRVRAVDLQLIDASGCPGYLAPLTRAEAQIELNSSCGRVANCPEPQSYLHCIDTALQNMLGSFRISNIDVEFFMLQTQNGLSYCNGYSQCTLDSNLEELQAQAYASGFNDGVASVDINAEVQAAYETGYDEGLIDGDQTGYQRGLGEGYTRGKNEGYALGYAKGFEDGKKAAPAPTCTFDTLIDQAKATIAAQCPCTSSRQFTQYVACAKRTLKLMRGGLLEELLETIILAQLKVNQCGRK